MRATNKSIANASRTTRNHPSYVRLSDLRVRRKAWFNPRNKSGKA